jgi:elongator complex protein 3
MLEFGTTRVELGVQSTKDSVLKKMQRGHTVKDSIEATELMKDSFLKVTYHMMPGFIKGFHKGSLNDELNDLMEIITNPDFRPDALKIYPALVIKGTELYELWKKGEFNPVNTEEAIELIKEFKQLIPEYMRVMRVQRDIPVQRVEAGVKKTNLRQMIRNEMKKENIECNCIRCREPFLSEKYKNKKTDFNNIEILTQEYDASSGKEIFISAEDVKNNILLGFCRLRINNLKNKKTAGIRELHVYGSALGLQKRKEKSIQHKGYGKILLKKAEEIAKNKYNIKKLFVISGVGVREYYRNLGYKQDGVYMSREL